LNPILTAEINPYLLPIPELMVSIIIFMFYS